MWSTPTGEGSGPETSGGRRYWTLLKRELWKARAQTRISEVVDTDTRAEANKAATSRERPVEDQDATAQQRTLREGQYYRLCAAVKVIPHPDKAHYGGEDAHFISTRGGGAVGVADGVGGWIESGVNPADYSREFMQTAQAYFEDNQASVNQLKAEAFDPKAALDAAHKKTRLPGSATACLLQLNPLSGILHTANLGDSGFMILRNKALLYRSIPQQHFFDCPLQFAAYPEHVEETDGVEDADASEIPVFVGDTILAATDGLWDNCYESELISLMSSSGSNLADIATTIAEVAYKNSLDAAFQSPYIIEARKQGVDLPWWEKLLGARITKGGFKLSEPNGGKKDDITVVIARVETSDGKEDKRQTESTSQASYQVPKGRESESAFMGSRDDLDEKLDAGTKLSVNLFEGSIGLVHAA